MTLERKRDQTAVRLTHAEVECLISELLLITHTGRIQPVLDELFDTLSCTPKQ
jgi:hypothetical protein